MTQWIGKVPAARRRGAAQLVLVMLVILVIGVATTGAVRRTISVRRAEQHRDRSLALERMLHAAHQWRSAGGEVGEEDVTLELPSRQDSQQSTVVLRRDADGRLSLTATLKRDGRHIATQSRTIDDPY